MLEKLWKKILRRKRYSILSIPAFFLWLCSWVYRIIYFFYIDFVKTKVALDIPVISIGNITVGGTGKTPLVEFLARFFINDGYKVGIVSSGWGRESKEYLIEDGYMLVNRDVTEVGDEVMYLASVLPEAVFSIGPVKAEAANNLSFKDRPDLIIVDDGFQHWKLNRDVDIVTFDGAVKSHYLKAFPYGLLREPIFALKRADILVITRANMSRDIEAIENRLNEINPSADHYRAQFKIGELVGKDNRLPVKYLDDKSVFLFAGIGNFRPLKKQVASLVSDLDYALELSDHQVYDSATLAHIKKMADKFDSDVILTTAKDWVKIGDYDFGRNIYYLTLTVDLDPGEEKLVSSLIDKLDLPSGVNDGKTV